MEARQDVLKSDENSVAHVQSPCNIRGGHGKRVRLPTRRLGLPLRLLSVRLKTALLLPPVVDFRLKGGGIVAAIDSSGLVGSVVLWVMSSFGLGLGCICRRAHGQGRTCTAAAIGGGVPEQEGTGGGGGRLCRRSGDGRSTEGEGRRGTRRRQQGE